MLLTTQYLDEADRLADCVAVMEGGRVVAQGSPDELKARVGGQQLDLWAADGAGYEELSRRTGAAALRTEPEELHLVLITPGEATKARALLDDLDPDGHLVKRFTLSAATLDDVFMALTATGEQKGPRPMTDSIALPGALVGSQAAPTDAAFAKTWSDARLMAIRFPPAVTACH